jgi:glyoxylase-like metal-dependent hydrolase (beta-lactamase superfamily II)/pimeloyl-ACP methyl ester carboxylesterase
MNKHHFGKLAILFSALLLMIISISCTSKLKETGKKISPEAAKIAPLFKSAKYQDEQGNVLPYRYFEPSSQNNSAIKFPVILYLHGENERGTDNEIQITSTECATIWAEPDHLATNPVYILAPQAPEGSDWTTEPVYSNVLKLLKQFIDSHPDIDPKRVYIVGFSMGGTGVWNMILKNPAIFAAAMPISGNADSFLGNYDAFAALKNMPVLVVHSVDDPISPVSGSNNAIAALQAAGNRCVGSNTSIWGMGSVIPAHNAWFPAFHNYEVIYNWLFEQNLEKTDDGAFSPSTLFSTRDLGDGVKEIWDYSLGTAYVIERSDKAVIIDAAAGDGNIFQFIRDKVLINKNIDIDIIITHDHFDHIIGLASFVGAPQLKKVYVHKEDSDPVKMILGADAGKVNYVNDGDKIPLGYKNIEVISIPGHSWGSIVMWYENNLFTGDAIGSGDVWLGGSILSIEDYIQSVQHLLDKIGNNKLTILGGHSGEYRSPMNEEYPRQMLACAKGLVDGSITGVPYRRTIGGQLTLGYAATFGRATIVYNLNNIHTIKGALRSITISKGNLNPRFAPYTTYYSATVESDVASVTITSAVLASKYDSITINGNAVDSGAPYETSLTKGENKFSIVITASDKTVKTYTLTITRGNTVSNAYRY